jgi:hypothetical protein
MATIVITTQRQGDIMDTTHHGVIAHPLLIGVIVHIRNGVDTIMDGQCLIMAMVTGGGDIISERFMPM